MDNALEERCGCLLGEEERETRPGSSGVREKRGGAVIHYVPWVKAVWIKIEGYPRKMKRQDMN